MTPVYRGSRVLHPEVIGAERVCFPISTSPADPPTPSPPWGSRRRWRRRRRRRRRRLSRRRVGEEEEQEELNSDHLTNLLVSCVRHATPQANT